MLMHGPEDWVYKTYGYTAVNLPVIWGVEYIGDEASGTIEAAATTGDLTLKHGDLSSEAVDSTVGTAGVLDMTTYTTVYSIAAAINASPNWHCWLVDFRGDYLTNVSAGHGLTATITAQQCKVAGGYLIHAVTSLKTAEDFPVGVTFNNANSEPHGKDAGVLHEILEVEANITYGGATSGIDVYECNDIDGTATKVDHFPLTSATLTYFPSGGMRGTYMAVQGRRLVFEAVDASGAITIPTLLVRARSKIIYPVVRHTNLLCYD